jgi:hypothetical protein
VLFRGVGGGSLTLDDNRARGLADGALVRGAGWSSTGAVYPVLDINGPATHEPAGPALPETPGPATSTPELAGSAAPEPVGPAPRNGL